MSDAVATFGALSALQPVECLSQVERASGRPVLVGGHTDLHGELAIDL